MLYQHITVMLRETVDYLNCKPGKIYVDGTLGGSGHAKAICEEIAPEGLLIGIDQDSDSIRNAEKVLKPYESIVRIFHDNFVNLPLILRQLNISAVDGILLDLGISFHQIESSGRGFSFNKDEPLDMRMNAASSPTAEELINSVSEEGLRYIFKIYGEEHRARQIARRIIQVRDQKKISSSKQLAQIVCDAIPKRARVHQRIHPATRVFMALRIAVNKELERLEAFMENVVDLLNPKGRLCVLAFHSLEDRIVKQRVKILEKGCICPPDFPKCVCNKKKVIRILTPKVLRPTKEEIAVNPRARSTRLRAIEKL
ncbi:MAG: 16S rRNA (cytosine(1402)-N(4))-methyltransferase RsmH [Deltaproteobacteria bacterium]|nr:16S rRNA (cytosine(1402)-N(4))-methyltransferase RsmH [Deltaproteobacteria bacterium]MBW2199654.1 16S rRNA (cytosine(1402)-N(4))-methyltransferase RsmH [Deltaproteobacteria bacterium]